MMAAAGGWMITGTGAICLLAVLVLAAPALSKYLRSAGG